MVLLRTGSIKQRPGLWARLVALCDLRLPKRESRGSGALLGRVGWNVEEQGLIGAPQITVIVSDESHVSIFASLQMLGLGSARVLKISTDDQGRLRADHLRMLAKVHTPFVVRAQVGNVNTGAFDPIDEIGDCVLSRSGWLHIDGAFGLWAAASPKHRHAVKCINTADSVALDCHKWLNVPYDCGVVFIRDAHAHRRAMGLHAPYYAIAPVGERDNSDWVPEASRRARGFTVYAALRTLGRNGLAELVERCCQLATRMRDRLSQDPGVQILNDVVLNQVLVRFLDPNRADLDTFTSKVIERAQTDGTCWLGGTTWHSMTAMRISISNWSTSEQESMIRQQRF